MPSNKSPAHKGRATNGGDPKAGSRTWVAIAAVAAGLSLAAEFLISKHDSFEIGNSFAFYGWMAALSCLIVVAGAVALRSLLSAPEDLYDR
ncbi:MAG: hypothetical protein AAFV26_02210 [Pseudomonadota bacterium]